MLNTATKKKQRAAFAAFAVVLTSFVLSGLAIESLLRAYPELIPLQYAASFPEPAVDQVATARDLPVEEEMIEVQRDDGGPPLLIHAPNDVRHTAAEKADLEQGAIELVRHDSEGFCNPRAVAQADIVILGDSFVWCTSVGSTTTWSARLGEQVDYRVTQLAMPGRGVYDYIQLLKSYGIQKNPKIVLLAYYEGNDLANARAYWDHQQASPTLTSDQHTRLVDGATTFLEKSGLGSSWAMSFLAVASWELLKDVNIAPINAKYDLVSGNQVVPFNVKNVGSGEVKHARDLAAGKTSLDILTEGFLEFSRLAEQSDFVPIVVYMPSAHSVYRESVDFVDPEVGKVLRASSLRQRDFVRKLASKLDMHFIDPTDELAGYDPALRNLLYFPANLHMTPSGHEAVAAIVAKELEAFSEVLEDRSL